MRRSCLLLHLAAAILLAGAARAETPLVPTHEDSTAVATAAAVASLYRAHGAELWPGYDPATMPLLLYVPGRWAMLLNPKHPAAAYAPASFAPWPAGWPDPGAAALLRPAGSDELVGQLAFDYEVGPDTTVAIPFASKLPTEAGDPREASASFVIHEQFHQYQRHAFAPLDAPSEERYPILDEQNSALAALELRLVLAALRELRREESGAAAAGAQAASALREAAALLVAVRQERWARLAPEVRQYEQAKEIVEGSAKYVEVRGMERLAGVAPGAYLARDGDSRLQDGALAPQDVPRNRIYPVAAAVGVLLDALGDRGWRTAVAASGPEFTLLGRLEAALRVPPGDLPGLAARARERYDFPAILAATGRLKAEYLAGWDAAMAAFAALPGLRLSVELPAQGLSRSRSSRERRWVMDTGARVFAANYASYTLQRVGEPAFTLRLTDRGVLEEAVPAPAANASRKRVTTHCARLDRLELDGRPLAPAAEGEFAFSSLVLEGPGAFLQSDLPGTLRRGGGEVTIRLRP